MPIPGAINSTMGIVGDIADHNADITVVVQNACGPLVSATRKLNVVAPACRSIWADGDGDGDVDMDDFGLFQACVGDASTCNAGRCHCFDREGDNDVDVTDLGAFMGCASGATVPAAPFCGGTVLFSDDFESNSSANWLLRASSTNHAMTLNYDYSAQGIPAAPNSSPGGTKGMKAAVNIGAGTELIAAVFYSTPTFTGDYTLRFDMWSNWNAGEAGTTTHAMFGINGDGTSIKPAVPTATAATAAPVDAGYLFAATVDGQNSVDRDFLAFEGTMELLPAVAGWVNSNANGNFLPFSNIFPSPRAVASGATGNGAGTGWGWVQVQIVHNATAGTVSLKLNDVVVLTRSVFDYPSGKLMLGAMDHFAGTKMSATMYTVFDNVVVTAP